MKLYALATKNRHNQYLIFTNKAAALRWGRAATRWTDPEILGHLQELTKSGEYFNFFPTTPNIYIEVSEGLVQSVYANTVADVEVIDTDERAEIIEAIKGHADFSAVW